MYIQGIGAAELAKATEKKSKKTGTSGFAGLLSAGESDTQTQEAAASGGVNPLFFLQEVNEDEPRKREAVKQGFDAIKYLDNIRMGLLTGKLSETTLTGLDAVLQKFRKDFTDPKLSQILDDIELRSKIELAKLLRN